jgi:hypothetical protein
MHKKGLCKKVSSCGTNRKTCYHISGRSVLREIKNKYFFLLRELNTSMNSISLQFGLAIYSDPKSEFTL